MAVISPEMGIPYIDGKQVISGGHPGLGVENGIGHEAAEKMMHSYYPRMKSRHSLGAAESHIEEGLFADSTFRRSGRGGSARAGRG